MGRRRLALCVAACLGLVVFASSVRADAPYLNWPDLLPALPTSANPQPGPQPGCAAPTMGCLDYEIARMHDAQTGFGCDHRGVFATTYLVLTQTLRDTVARQPGFFVDPHYLFDEDALFAHYYFRTLDDWAAGRPIPEAWRIAFQTAASGDANAAQDMLLGINAHVQRDMPYVMASLGLHRPDGSSRKADHDRFNEILNHAYNAVVSEIAKRFDPIVGYTNPKTVADNLTALELVKGWREGVWRNAERLLNARTPADRAAVENSIETTAATSARAIAAIQLPPGYRATRDAYCAAHLAAAPTPAVHSPATATHPSHTSRRHRGRRRQRRVHHRHAPHRRHVTRRR
jgi:Family of unknown function (DUF5995)